MKLYELEKTVEVEGEDVVKTCKCEAEQLELMKKAGWSEKGGKKPEAPASNPLQEDVDAAKAELADAEAELEKAITQSGKDSAKAKVDAAKQKLQDAEDALSED